ncbi:hypothetical protein O0C54_12090 [Staphylococcus pseudintermedius]|nr:hypothetical protein [Staphylococcus pseudintermedius]
MSEKKELSNEELLRKQEEKFEAYKKEQASKSKNVGYGDAVVA